MDLTGISSVSSLAGVSIGTLLVLTVWSLIWKGIALWKSAMAKSKVWFVLLLVINTFGILEILYIFIFSKIGIRSISAKKTGKKK